MIKRFSAISFTLLANIILLAHVVLPHHHHDTEICMERDHCASESSTHDHEGEDADHKDHKHHGDREATNCVLDQDIGIISIRDQQDFCLYEVSLKDTYHKIFNQSIVWSSQIISTNLANAPPLLINTDYSEYAPATLGLRAPPTV